MILHKHTNTHTHTRSERDVYLGRENTETEFFFIKRTRRNKLQIQNTVRHLVVRTAALYCTYVRQRAVYAQMPLFLYNTICRCNICVQEVMFDGRGENGLQEIKLGKCLLKLFFLLPKTPNIKITLQVVLRRV
jgi:hypothetical protein